MKPRTRAKDFKYCSSFDFRSLTRSGSILDERSLLGGKLILIFPNISGNCAINLKSKVEIKKSNLRMQFLEF